jgi:hypothetical protein
MFERGDCIVPVGGSYKHEYVILGVVTNGYKAKSLYTGKEVNLPRVWVDTECEQNGSLCNYKSRKVKK